MQLNHSTLHVETIVLSQLASTIKTVKTVKIQLDDLVARHPVYRHVTGIYLLMVHQRLLWQSPMHSGIIYT